MSICVSAEYQVRAGLEALELREGVVVRDPVDLGLLGLGLFVLRRVQASAGRGGFFLEVLALAHVAHERLDAHRAAGVGRGGRGGDLEPHRRAVGAAQPQQVVGHRAGHREPFEEGGARLRIGETAGVEGPHLAFDGVGRVAEHQLQVRVGRQRGGGRRADEADVHAFVYSLEQAGKC